MTASDTLQILHFDFDADAESQLAQSDSQLSNWPVVYILRNEQKRLAYVGESTNVVKRVGQHYASKDKVDLRAESSEKVSRIVLDGQFNKSAALDLEAFLIQHLAGDGKYQLLNRNDGIVDRNYFQRDEYQRHFRSRVFEELRKQGLFSRSIEEVENDDLFKLSPYKALEPSQEHAVKSILQIILKELDASAGFAPMVVEGDPGTGKTIIAVFLIKLLVDIATTTEKELLTEDERESDFPEFFLEQNRRALHELLNSGLGIGLVVPQQSLRESIKRVFKRIPNLDPAMVVDPFSVGKNKERYSLLVVDEAHRLNQRANQSSGMRNKDFAEINHRLFANEDDAETKTQLDWITAQSDHQVLLMDSAQTVRPADLPLELLRGAIADAEAQGKHHRLTSQLRVKGGNDFIEHIRDILQGSAPEAKEFGEYEFQLFDDPAAMHEEIRRRNRKHGLARMAGGYAWEWRTKGGKPGYDIEIGHYRAQWNSTDKDWVDSKNSLSEVGSIHTLQGYDLNYAGVIIGNELKFDEESGRITFDRSQYFDKKGMENNRYRDKPWSDEEILEYIKNIYFVLLTRGRLGTFVYVCDPGLRRYMRRAATVDLMYSEVGQFNMENLPTHGKRGVTERHSKGL